MKFHDVHGVNVTLNEQKTTARRINSFCDAFVFSCNPIRLNSSIVIKLSSQQTEWNGFCFLGLTSKNPNSFIESIYSKHIINLLTQTVDDVWINSIAEQWSNANLILSLNSDGQLEITTEYDPCLKYIFLENLPVNFPLWLVIDLYGRTDQVCFPSYSSPNSREIVSLGSDVYSTFKCGESSGIVPYNSAHIILIGPKSGGKTQLKSMLIDNLNAESKDVTNFVSSNYYMCTTRGDEWQLLPNPLKPNKITMKELNSSQLFQEIAKNIVHEIVLTSQMDEQLRDTFNSSSPKELIKNVLKLPRKLLRPYSKEMKQLSENMNTQIPDELMTLIEDMLKNITNETSNKDQASNNNETGDNSQWKSTDIEQKYVIHISDLGGDLLYLFINQSELGNQTLPILRSMHLWISLIHSTIAGFSVPDESTTTLDSEKENKFDLQPKIVLVGTHRNSTHGEPIIRNQKVKEKFEIIHSSFDKTSYGGHLLEQCVALDSNEMSFDEPELVKKLKNIIKLLVQNEKMSGFCIPLCWMQLEQILEKFKQRGIYFVDIYQLHEVVSSQIDAFQSYETLCSALNFYHNQGKIFYLDCVNSQQKSSISGHEVTQGTYEISLIILDPNWFINCIYDLCKFICSEIKNDDENLFLGTINENCINNAWSNYIDQKFILIGCLENLDLICELNPYLPIEDAPDVAATSIIPKLYFFPWITKPTSTWIDPNVEFSSNEKTSTGSSNNNNNGNNNNNNGDLSDGDPSSKNYVNLGESMFQFVINFNILPLSLFTRLMVRLSKWSWNQGWGRKPEMFNAKGRIAVDFDHDIILKINLLQGRIYLIILKIFEEIHTEQIENLFVGPTASVQHLIENELVSLKNCYYRRLCFKLDVPCPCDASCENHSLPNCPNESCMHFLNLHECLQKKVVECQFNRQVRTTFIQRFLPFSATVNNDLLYESMFSTSSNVTNVWENIFQIEQLWMKEAAKMLNGRNSGANNSSSSTSSSDWITLAKRLSYTERDIMKFSSELSPSLALLKDWYESNGQTRYCIDVLVSCLRMLSREDIASMIEYELEPESVSPPIFLSYHHDSQKQVLEIRRKLELSGFPCWMDTRFINGGDSLYGKIYEGISRAKVFICCLTPRYIASPMCNREVALADVLHKPILPLIIEFTPWPPPGAMALIMSSIVYVDLCGVGSHHGTGRTQDTESCFRKILDHITRYVAGYNDTSFISSRYIQLPDLFNSNNDHKNNSNHYHSGGGRNRTQNILMNHHFRHKHYSHVNRRSSTSTTSSILRQQHNLHLSSSLIVENDLEQIIEGVSSHNSGSATGVNASISNEHRPSSDSLNLQSQMPREHHHGIPFSEEIITDDNISVITRVRLANRITNCSVCLVM